MDFLLPCVGLLTLTAAVSCGEHGVKVVVKEGDDAILPCSLVTKEDIQSKLFDWKKDRQKEVFLYDGGTHYSNGRSGQDDQFKGRVSHFEEELRYGNASIMIRNVRVADSGDFTCDFPRQGQIFHIWLVVDRDPHLPLKDLSGEISGAAQKPCITVVNETKDEVRLMCKVDKAFPEPKVEWKDSDGNVLPADKPQVSERGGHYSVTVNTTVAKTKTKRFRCVVSQPDIGHTTAAEINLLFCEKTFGDTTNTWIPGIFIGFVFGVFVTLVVVSLLLARCGAPKCITNKLRTPNSHTDSPEQGNANSSSGQLLNSLDQSSRRRIV